MIEADTRRGMKVFKVGSPLPDAQEVCSGGERAAWACRAVWIASNPDDAEVVPCCLGVCYNGSVLTVEALRLFSALVERMSPAGLQARRARPR